MSWWRRDKFDQEELDEELSKSREQDQIHQSGELMLEGDAIEDDPTEVKFQELPDVLLEESDQKKRIKEFKSTPEYLAIMSKYPDSRYARFCQVDSDFIFKFLVDANWKVKRAVRNFVAMMEWRESVSADEAFSWRFDVDSIRRHYTQCFLGFDKFGAPVYMERIGGLDVKGVLGVVNSEEFLRYHILHWEFIHRVLFPIASARAGRKITQVISIVDVSGLGRSHLQAAVFDILKNLAKVDQEMFPESGAKLYVVNVPWIFKAVWKLIRPLLSAKGKRAIEVVRGDCKKVLLEKVFDLESLPEVLGGSAPWGQSE